MMKRSRLVVWSVTTSAVAAVSMGLSARADVTVGDVATVVVGDSSAVTIGDTALVAALADIGYSPQVVDDSAPSATGALVVLAPSSDAATLGGKYTNSTVPVLTLNVSTWSNLGLTSAVGSVYNTTNLLVIDGASPIVNGLSSTFTVSTTTDPLGSVNTMYVPASVDTVAARSGSSSAAVVLSLGFGGARSDTTNAPAGRVAMGLTDAALDSLSDDGVQLIENAVFWLSNQVDPAAPKAATLKVAGKWNLNDKSTLPSNLPSKNQITDSTFNKNGDFPGFGSTTTVQQNQAAVYTAAGHSNYFPGWHDLSSSPCPSDTTKTCDFVVADASLAHIEDLANRLSPGAVPASGGSAPFWTVQVDVRADPLTVETSRPNTWDNSANPFGEASPNIIQQGKASNGGQWKVSQHPKSGSSQQYTISCDFQDTTNAVRTAKPLPNVFLTANLDYHVECALLRGGLPRLRIWLKGQTNPVIDATGSYTAAPYTVTPADDVYIGKKFSRAGGTGSLVHANDAFAGYIDNILIKTTR